MKFIFRIEAVLNGYNYDMFPKYELYDLQKDKKEQYNINNSLHDAYYSQLLREFIHQHTLKHNISEKKATSVSDETLQRLRGLGYFE